MSRASRLSKKITTVPEQESSKFNVEHLEMLANDLKTGRLKLDRLTVSDNIVKGLRAIVRSTGLVSFHVYYTVGADDAAYLKIGVMDPKNPDHLTIPEARELARTIKALGKTGIDPQSGLHQRLVAELKSQGVNWKP